MPNRQAPIPERLVTRNLSKIPIEPSTLVQRRCRPAVAGRWLVSGRRRFRRHPHITGANPGVKDRPQILGNGSYAPRNGSGGQGGGDRDWRFAVLSLGTRPWSDPGKGTDLPVQQDDDRTNQSSQGLFPSFPTFSSDTGLEAGRGGRIHPLPEFFRWPPPKS